MKKIIPILGIITVALFVTFFGKETTMGFFKKLFGLEKETSSKVIHAKDLSEYRQRIETFKKPCFKIEAGSEPGISKIGGLPKANASLQWPSWKGRPLAFLCQIDLGAIQKSELTQILPQEGVLYFFYDQEQSTWGFDPKDRGSWRIIYMAEGSDLQTINAPAGLGKDYIYDEKYIQFSEAQSYPDLGDERIEKLNLNDAQSDEYYELRMSAFGNQPMHQLLGYPLPVQGSDMDLESQLASNGLYCGDASGYNDPRAKKLESGRDDWILLLQLDSDDDAGMMWGDVGMLYFWIRKADLKNINFNDAWMILQCH